MMLRSLAVALCFQLACTHAASVPAETPSQRDTTQQVQALSQRDTTEVVVSWLRQKAIPLRHVEAGNGFADLQPLKTVLEGVTIVGLGESTHGTREFFQVKHRMLEFLVAEMGFTAFALEAAYSDVQRANDYVLHGRGDPATVQTALGYVAWDTEEVAAMIAWMRNWNRRAPEARRVKFFGLDVYRNEVGRNAVLGYLRTHSPEMVPSTDSVFRILAAQEAKWPWWDTSSVKATLPRLRALADHLNARVESGPQGLASEADRMAGYLRVMIQGVRTIASDLRSGYMGENLIYLLEREGPDAKAVVWAHNGHVVEKYAAETRATTGRGNTLGGILRQQYGDRYYAVALEFEHGSFQYRRMPPTTTLEVGVVPPPLQGTLPWYLARTGYDNFFLDLRSSVDDPVVRRWLGGSHQPHGIGWGFRPSPDPTVFYPRSDLYANLPNHFDGIIFIRTSTPVRPTATAKEMSATHRGF